MKIAVCQMRSTDDPFFNLLRVNDFVKAAEAAGAEIVFFPENVFYRGPTSGSGFSREDLSLELNPAGALVPDSAFSSTLEDFLMSWNIHVSLGSVFEKVPQASKPFNSHLCFDPATRSFGRYRKIHLFDYQATSGSQYRESDDVAAGTVSEAVRVGTANIGLSICYDLRFPELYRELSLVKNCQILAIPAAFTRETGKAHWHTLLRARAIENQTFVVASAQWGSHRNSAGAELFCFGNSAVYSPWGDLLFCGKEEADHLDVVNLDLTEIDRVRAKLPAIYGAKFFQSSESA